MNLEVHDINERHAVATLGCVVIRIIDTAPTGRADIDQLALQVEALLERSSVVGVWVVISHGAPIPTMNVSRHASRVFGDLGMHLSVVYSMLGLGFWAATARAATGVLNTILGSTSIIEASVEAGAKRLAMELLGVNSDELIRAHEQLRARMQAPHAGVAAVLEPEAQGHKALEPEPAASASPSSSRVGARSMTRPFRLILDEALCDGHGMCVAEAPELFTLVGDKARLEQAQPDPKLWFKADAACRFCPQRALTIEEL